LVPGQDNRDGSSDLAAHNSCTSEAMRDGRRGIAGIVPASPSGMQEL
jgi:hypothetical protein